MNIQTRNEIDLAELHQECRELAEKCAHRPGSSKLLLGLLLGLLRSVVQAADYEDDEKASAILREYATNVLLRIRPMLLMFSTYKNRN